MSTSSIQVILPFLIVVATGMVALLWDAFLLPAGRKSALVWISFIGIAAGIVSLHSIWGRDLDGFNGTVTGDGFALLFQFIILIVTLLGILLSEQYIQQKNINFGEYYALILFSASGAMLMSAARELILIFIGLEILSIALYVLSGFARTEEKSEEAAIKYFLLGAFSSGFFLYGIALFYGGTGTTILANVPTLAQSAASSSAFSLSSPYTVAGIAFILVGLCFKAAIVPFHSWTPDVYQGAPTSVTAYMSAGAKAGAFAALIRVLTVVLPVSQVWRDVLWILAAATMIVGNVVALWQRDIKRMLAYSSIAQAGYILVGVLAANQDGRAAVLFYMLVYTFMNLGAFGVILLLARTGQDRTRMSDLQGLGRSHPFAATLMTIFLFSLAGVPPAAGFLGKFYIFQAAIEAHLIGLVTVLALSSVVGVFYYIYVIARMWFMPAEVEVGHLSWSPWTNVALGVCAGATLLLFLIPGPIVTTFSAASNSLAAPQEAARAVPAQSFSPVVRSIFQEAAAK